MNPRVWIIGLLVGAAACERLGTPASRQIVVEPQVVTLDGAGKQLILSARLLIGGRWNPDSSHFTWRSSNPQVAFVTDSGVVTGVTEGVARVWAARGSDSAFAVVVVQTGAEQPAAPLAAGPAGAVTLEVAPNRLAFDALGARADLRVAVSGEGADSIPVRCVSANPAIAQMDSLAVIARGNGTAQVRCVAGGAETLVAVSVRQRVARIKITSPRGFLARLGRDTLRLTLARVDRLRNPVPGREPRWVSLDTAVVTVDAAGEVQSVKVGEGKVVAVLGALNDTAQIRVVEKDFVAATVQPQTARGGAAGTRRTRGAVRGAGRAAGGAVGAGGAARQGASGQVGARDIKPGDGVFQSGGGLAMPFGRLTGSGFVSNAEHRVDLGLKLPVERVTGLLFGGELVLAPFRRADLRFFGFGGNMTAQTPGAKDRLAVDVRGELELAPFSWLWIQLGGGLRGYRTENPTVNQRYLSGRTGLEARFPLAAGAVDAVARVTLLPVTLIRPQMDSPSLGMETGVGVDYHAGRVSFGVRYEVQRLDFPAVNGAQRREQFSAVRIRAGLDVVKR